jgi:AraC-like DNA-binding protein
MATVLVDTAISRDVRAATPHRGVGADALLGSPRAIPRLPGPARLIVLPVGTSLSAETRCRFHAQVTRVSVLGPTSRAATLWVHGPAPIEVELDALAWSRRTKVRADTLTDRIVAGSLLDIGDPGDLADAAACASFAHNVVSCLDVLRHDAPDDVLVRKFTAMTQRLDIADVATAADELGVNPHTLRRLTLRHFGFPPKLLLVRARFLAAFVVFQRSGMRFDSVLDFGYFDSSHFLRDANRFLGTTPKRYLERFAALLPCEWRRQTSG